MTEHTDVSLNSLIGDSDLNGQDREFIRDLVANEFYYRRDLLDKLKHPNRDIDQDCGYPETRELVVEKFKNLYERFPIAARVVNLPVEESWRKQPNVFETEEEDDETEFELAWKDLNKQLRGEESWFQDAEGSPIWEHLERGDRLSRIGHYGVVFLEFDDVGKPRKARKGEVLDDGDVITWEDPAPGFEDAEEVEDEFPEEHGGTKFEKESKSTKGNHGLNTNAFGDDEDEDDDDDEEKEETDEDETDDTKDPKAGDEDGEFGADDGEKKAPKQKHKLLGLRCFDESLARIAEYVEDEENRRNGKPLSYVLTLTKEESSLSGEVTRGVSTRDVRVHWSRIIHVADMLSSSEVLSVPACQPVTNDLMDLQKIYGASGEGYWRMAFPGLSFESHPQLGGKAKLDTTSIKEQIQRYQHTMQRYLSTSGGTVKMLAGEVSDPSPHVEVRLEAICIYLGCPVRIFKGSERGELASSQDKDSWDERMIQRQNAYITPRIIVPFIDRLIQVGVLPEPKGYSVSWPDLSTMGREAQSTIALSLTQALVAYAGGGADTMIDPFNYLTKVLNFDRDEAEEIMEATLSHINDANPEEDDVDVIGRDPVKPPMMGFDEEGNPIDPEMAEGGPPFGKNGKPQEGEEDDEEEKEPFGKKKKKPFGKQPVGKKPTGAGKGNPFGR